MLPGHNKINTLKFHKGSNLDIIFKYTNKNEYALSPLNHLSCRNL